MKSLPQNGVSGMIDSSNKKRLSQLRLDKNLTQEQVAEMAGLAWITIAKLEGGNHNPNLDTLRQLETVLGSEVYALEFGWRRKAGKKRGRPRKQATSTQPDTTDFHQLER
jgi:transcriptional regulator with XRE-family HTH domain